MLVLAIQTIVFVATLIVLMVQIRQQTRALKKAEYARCASDYSALIRMMIEKPELQSIYDDIAQQDPAERPWTQYKQEDKVLFNYFELNIELFERVFYLWKDRSIDPETWETWQKWIRYLAQHKIFHEVCRSNLGMFGQEFERFVIGLGKTGP